MIGAIDKVAELEREIGRRRQNTFRAIAAVAVAVGLTVTLLTNPWDIASSNWRCAVETDTGGSR